MSPELIEFFRDFPLLILFLVLAAPFFVFLGVVSTGIVQRLRDKGQQKTTEKSVAISETEAETHQFQAIIEGFERSLAAVSGRAETAEAKANAAEIKASEANAKAEAAEEKANKLSRRVRSLEDERHEAITHVLLLEALIPYPPGPPERPAWMRQLVRPHSDSDEPDGASWVPEKDPDE